MRNASAAGPRLALVFSTVLAAAGAMINPVHGEGLSPWCGEFQDRTAELEPTPVRSGTRNLSFRLYGQVNRALLLWKDGFDTGDHVVDNHTSSSRFGFVGSTSIRPGLTAGYRIEIEAAFPSSEDIFNAADGRTGIGPGTDRLRVRQKCWTGAGRDLGGVGVGYQSWAKDDVSIINLGSQMNDAAVHYNNAFRTRLDLAKPAIITDLTWGQIAHNVDALRGHFVRYDSPILHGWLLSTAWKNEAWDVALR